MADIAATLAANSDNWRSPLWLFQKLDYEFNFTLDVAADADNSLCEEYFDEEINGLTQSWSGHTCWCNHPYSQTKFWMRKAWSEAIEHKVTTVMLAAARPDTQHWWEFAAKAEVRFLPGRLKFTLSPEEKVKVQARNLVRKALGKKPLDPEKTSAPFPSALVIFRNDLEYRTPTMSYWNMREKRK